MATAEANTMD